MFGQLTHQLLLGGSRRYPQRVSPSPGYLEESWPSCVVTQLSANKGNKLMIRFVKSKHRSNFSEKKQTPQNNNERPW